VLKVMLYVVVMAGLACDMYESQIIRLSMLE